MISTVRTTILRIILLSLCAMSRVLAESDLLGVVLSPGTKGQPQHFPSIPAEFGPELSRVGHSGLLLPLEHDGCDLKRTLGDFEEFTQSEYYRDSVINSIIALIPRSNCSFDTKVYFAELSGANSVIVHQETGKVNNETDYSRMPSNAAVYGELVRMKSAKYARRINIPSVFISYEASVRLRDMYAEQHAKVGRVLPVYLYSLSSSGSPGSEWGNYERRERYMASYGKGNSNTMNSIDRLISMSDMVMLYMAALATASLFGWIILITLVIAKYRAYRIHCELVARSRMSADELKLLKKRKLSAGDLAITAGEHCPICLDDFVADDLIRELPCRHQYHASCIDDWLTQRHRSCPTCRQEALPFQSGSSSRQAIQNINSLV